jgi:hypothetical protein
MAVVTYGEYHPFDYGQVSVTSSPTLIVAQDAGTKSVSIENTGSNTIYIGDAAVATTTGLPLIQFAAVQLQTTNAIYAVATSTGTAAYIKCR